MPDRIDPLIDSGNDTVADSAEVCPGKDHRVDVDATWFLIALSTDSFGR